MTEAPKRIWATEDAENHGEDRFHSTTPFARGSEYILAAEHDRIVAEARRAALEEAQETKK